MEEIKFDKAQPIMSALKYCREAVEKVKDEEMNINIKFNNTHGYCSFSPENFAHFTSEDTKQIHDLTKLFIMLLLETKIKKLEQEISGI